MKMAEVFGVQSFDVAQPFNRCLMESSSSKTLPLCEPTCHFEKSLRPRSHGFDKHLFECL